MEVRNIRFPRTVYAIQHNITKRIYPILGRIPPLLSEVKVGDECRLFFLLKLLTISKIYAIIDT